MNELVLRSQIVVLYGPVCNNVTMDNSYTGFCIYIYIHTYIYDTGVKAFIAVKAGHMVGESLRKTRTSDLPSINGADLFKKMLLRRIYA
jgi:hypothetical protein